MRCTLKKMIVILTMSFALIAGSQPAKALDPVTLGFFLLGQLVNDGREKPVEHNTVSLNPIYNTMWQGAFIGANPDPKTMVAANCRGTQIVWEPGQMSRADIVGFELIPNTDLLPVKLGVYHKSLVDIETVKVKTNNGTIDQEKITSDKVDLKVGQNQIIDGNPAFAKWQLPIDTSALPQGLYLMKVRVYFIEREACGIFNASRRDALRREEVVCRFVVLDQNYMQQAANSPDIQARLRASFGLMAGPPQVGGMQIAVNPAMAQNLPQPQLQQQQPVPQPQQQLQPLPVPQSQYLPQQQIQAVPQIDGMVASSASVNVSASASSNCQPSPAPLLVCATVCICKGAEKQMWYNQSVDQNWFNQLVAFSRQNGGSRLVIFKTRQGAFVAATEVRAQVLQDNNGTQNTVEFQVYQGDWPTLDCQMFPAEENR